MEADTALLPARPCRPEEAGQVLAIINHAAEAYHGRIPQDFWHEPYMSAAELQDEMQAGVGFSGIERDGALIAVMGIQKVRDRLLIRHAYVVPSHQGSGLGGRLLEQYKREAAAPMLVGTWAAATWAIGFYQRHGFALVPPPDDAHLLRRYWTVSARQIETSVVLAFPPMQKAQTE